MFSFLNKTSKSASPKEKKLDLSPIQLKHGRLLDYTTVDAIAFAITDDMSMGSPLNEAILEAAGPGLEEEILEHIYKPKAGQAYAFSGYNLPVEHVIVSVKPSPQSAVMLEDKYLLRIYRSVMDIAKKRGITSLSIPAMGNDYLRYPSGRAARLGLQALSQSFYPELETVNLVCKEKDLHKAFQQRLKLLKDSQN